MQDDNKNSLNFNELGDLLGFQLRRAQQKLFQDFMRSFQQQGISPGQAGVLILVKNNPGISQAALARAIGVERATLGETIGFLESRNWIRRKVSETDRRSYALELNAPGKFFCMSFFLKSMRMRAGLVQN